MDQCATRRSPAVAVALALLVGGCAGATVPQTLTPTPTVAPTQAATPAPTPVAATPTPGSISVSASGILGALPTEPPGTTWIRVSDPSAPFTYEVPATWTSSGAGEWDEGGTTIGYVLGAGTDVQKVGVDFSASGVLIGVSANPTGLTPRAVAEEDDFSAGCTATPTEDVVQADYQAAYRSWVNCGPGGTGFVISMAIAPAIGGLLAVVFQGSRPEDLGYIEHIVASLLPTASSETPPPGPVTPGPVTPGPGGELYTYTLDLCQNQHGQGVAEGLLTNQDTVGHKYRVRVRFYDQAGAFLNDVDSFDSSEVRPGESYRWQAVVPSGLPSGLVGCEVSQITIVF